jgi:hypothetical protein
MVLADERIMEILADMEKASPQLLADDERMPWGKEHINQRLWKLRDAGLVVRVGRGIYSLSESGCSYLEGEFDARDLEKPD